MAQSPKPPYDKAGTSSPPSIRMASTTATTKAATGMTSRHQWGRRSRAISSPSLSSFCENGTEAEDRARRRVGGRDLGERAAPPARPQGERKPGEEGGFPSPRTQPEASPAG